MKTQCFYAGGISIQITVDPRMGTVALDFGQPVTQITFPFHHAAELGRALVEHAKECEELVHFAWERDRSWR